jgi:hypothetical protein
MTDKKLYETYCAEAQKGEIVSKQFFIYTIMVAERVHHAKRPKFCPLYEIYDNREITLELKHHKQLISSQKR